MPPTIYSDLDSVSTFTIYSKGIVIRAELPKSIGSGQNSRADLVRCKRKRPLKITLSLPILGLSGLISITTGLFSKNKTKVLIPDECTVTSYQKFDVLNF